MPRDLIKESNNLYRKDGLIKKSIQDKTVAAFIALAQQQGISTIGLTTPELKKGDEQAIVDFSNNEDEIEPTLYENVANDISHLYETPQLQELFDENENTEGIQKLQDEIKIINKSVKIYTDNIIAHNAAITTASERINAITPKANANTIAIANKTIATETAAIKKAESYIAKAPSRIANTETAIQALRTEIVERNIQIEIDNQLEISNVNKKTNKYLKHIV